MNDPFLKVCELGIALNKSSLNQTEGCWEHQVDEHWWFALNPHPTEEPHTKSTTSVPPFTVYVEFNGWPAGIFNPQGGTFAAGTLANEETFVKALDAAIAAAVPEV